MRYHFSSAGWKLLDKENLILLCIYILLSLMFGASIFFTFVVGPALFSGLDKKTAGYAMNLIFPYYFKIQWLGGVIVYMFVGLYSYFKKSAINTLKYFMFSLFVLVIINMAMDRAIVPLSNDILTQYYETLKEGDTAAATILKDRFDNLHMVSYWLNMVHIFVISYLVYSFFKLKSMVTKIF